MSRITLSFDNGPDPDVTPLVLDVLAAFVDNSPCQFDHDGGHFAPLEVPETYVDDVATFFRQFR